MKEKEIISYNKGITRAPSDFLCSDGEMAECINLEVRNEELVPTEMPLKLPYSMNGGERLLCIHNIVGDDRKNYIYSYYTSGHYVLSAFYVENDTRKGYNLSVNMNEIKNVVTLGNTVVVYTEYDTYYILYTGYGYKVIGNRLPDINISFNLVGDYVVQTDESQVIISNQRESSNPNVTKNTTDLYKSAINKFIEEKATSQNKFMYPFFVRYALVLSNGERVCHSAPILMIPSTEIAPQLLNYEVSVEDSQITKKFGVGAYVADLQYRVNNIDNIEDWKDVIRGVEVFISRQSYNYDQSYEEDDFVGSLSKNENNFSIGDIASIDNFAETGFSPVTHLRVHTKNIFTRLYNLSDSAYWEVPKSIGTKRLTNSIIENSSIFYRYILLPIDEIYESSEYTTLNSDNGYITSSLSTIEQQETLDDDYMTHDILIPEFATVYNGRLNIANIKRKLYNGFTIESMTQPMGATANTDGSLNQSSLGYYNVYVYIRTSSGEEVVVKESGDVKCRVFGSFVFYPDTDAYRMVVHNTTHNTYSDIQLIEHPGLNGAYAFLGFDGMSFISGSPSITESAQPYDYMTNKLFTSYVNNPFYFPLEGINTIGSSEIRGLSAITRPISTGQFGEYPLIAFCSDGNFALRVDEEGYYSGISPIQEDVVLNGKQITSLEDAVIIVTQKGLMITNGGQMTKLAVLMDGPVFDVSKLTDVRTTDESFSKLIDAASDDNSFLAYLKGSRIAFDYASNRLLIYNPDKTYTYLYNFDNSTISKAVFGDGAKIVASAIDYPDTIIQDENGSLYSLYDKQDINTITDRKDGILITRPLKFGNVMALKSLFQIKNLGTLYSSDSFIKYNIYGSNDNINYYKASSRFGKPYKYYRMAIYTRLLPVEAFSGTVVTKEERRVNKLR